MRVLVLVDGEHYPPVTRWGIEAARDRGFESSARCFWGASRRSGREAPDLGVPVRRAGDDRVALAEAIDEWAPRGVLDLSDEPVVGYRERMELAAVALARGVRTSGRTSGSTRPSTARRSPRPTLAVIGTGKRTGQDRDRRGGRPDRGRPRARSRGRGDGSGRTRRAAGGRGRDRAPRASRSSWCGAASTRPPTTWRMALTTGVTTSAPGGPGGAGRPPDGDERPRGGRAGRRARGRGRDRRRGAGRPSPSMPWDAGILVVPAACRPSTWAATSGPLRLLLSDLVVVTMAAGPAGLENLPHLRSHVERLHADAAAHRDRLRATATWRTCRVRGCSSPPRPRRRSPPGRSTLLQAAHRMPRWWGGAHRLADRAGLAEDLERPGGYDVFLTELKAAAVDIGERAGPRRGGGGRVHGQPAVAVDVTDLDTALGEVLDLARERRSTSD